MSDPYASVEPSENVRTATDWYVDVAEPGAEGGPPRSDELLPISSAPKSSSAKADTCGTDEVSR